MIKQCLSIFKKHISLPHQFYFVVFFADILVMAQNYRLFSGAFSVMAFSDGSDSKESARNAGDLGLILESGRSPGYPL